MPRLYEVPLGGTLDVVGQVCLRNLSLGLSLERFYSSFRLFDAGIINEVLLARHLQASTIPVI